MNTVTITPETPLDTDFLSIPNKEYAVILQYIKDHHMRHYIALKTEGSFNELLNGWIADLLTRKEAYIESMNSSFNNSAGSFLNPKQNSIVAFSNAWEEMQYVINNYFEDLIE